VVKTNKWGREEEIFINIIH